MRTKEIASTNKTGQNHWKYGNENDTHNRNNNNHHHHLVTEREAEMWRVEYGKEIMHMYPESYGIVIVAVWRLNNTWNLFLFVFRFHSFNSSLFFLCLFFSLFIFYIIIEWVKLMYLRKITEKVRFKKGSQVNEVNQRQVLTSSTVSSDTVHYSHAHLPV